MRLQQGVDRVGNTCGLGAKQTVETLRHQRQQETHHVVWPYAQRGKHIGGLRHPCQKLRMADHHNRLGRIGIRQKLDRWCLRVVRGADTDRVIGAGGVYPLMKRRGFQRAYVCLGGQ